MRTAPLCLTLVFFMLGFAFAQSSGQTPDHHKSGGDTAGPDQAQIVVTINPEARVSVVWAGNLSPPVPCGTPVNLRMRIVNRGFVTSRLEVEPVGAVRDNVQLAFEPVPLKGLPEEVRDLHITLTKPDPTDITLAFKLHNETPDLGGRDRIHFLLRCLEAR